MERGGGKVATNKYDCMAYSLTTLAHLTVQYAILRKEGRGGEGSHGELEAVPQYHPSQFSPGCNR